MRNSCPCLVEDVLGQSESRLTANRCSHAVAAALRQATDALEKAYRGKAEERARPASGEASL